MKRLMEGLAELPEHPVYVALIFTIAVGSMLMVTFITTI